MRLPGPQRFMAWAACGDELLDLGEGGRVRPAGDAIELEADSGRTTHRFRLSGHVAGLVH